MAKILVIDDEELMRELVKKMLMRDGYEVFLANETAKWARVVEAAKIALD